MDWFCCGACQTSCVFIKKWQFNVHVLIFCRFWWPTLPQWHFVRSESTDRMLLQRLVKLWKWTISEVGCPDWFHVEWLSWLRLSIMVKSLDWSIPSSPHINVDEGICCVLCLYVWLLYIFSLSVYCMFLQYFDTVGWVFWPVKTVFDITYTVLAGT